MSDVETPEAETRPRALRAPAWLHCRVCSHRVTPADSAISFDGDRRHRFRNPAGLAFVIVLHDEAPGCVAEGEASEYWSWFPGYAWCVAVCAGCRFHLGWRFECVGPPGVGEPDGFHGLIEDRLRPG